MPEIISRKEAMALGLKRYFTGRPCVHGHTTERRVTSSHCIGCESIRDQSDYLALKAERLKEYKRKYYQAHKEEMKKRYEENRIENLQKQKKWRDDHADHVRERSRKYIAKTYEKRRQQARERYARNAERIRQNAKKRARKVTDLLAVLREEMPEILKEFGL